MRCLNAAIAACGKGSQWRRGLAVLQDLQEGAHGSECMPDAVSYNAAIGACSRISRWQHSEALLAELTCGAAAPPDRLSFRLALAALDRGSKWERCLRVIGDARQHGVTLDAAAFGLALSSLAKGGDWRRALALVEEAADHGAPRDLPMYCSLMSACLRDGEPERGLDLFAEAEADGLAPDAVAYETALQLCQSAGLWERGLATLGAMRGAGFEPTTISYLSVLSACDPSCDREGAPQAVVENLIKTVRGSVVALLAEPRLAAGNADGSGASGSLVSWGVRVVAALDELHRRQRLDAHLEELSREVLYGPALDALMRQAGHGAPPSVQQPGLAAQAGLGTFFTQEALGSLGASSGVASWLPLAQKAVASNLLLRAVGSGADLGEHNLARALGSTARPPGRLLCVWVSCSVGEPAQPGQLGAWAFKEEGRIVENGQHKWDQGQDLLRPVFVGHDRGAHPERRALLQVAQRIVESAAEADPTSLAVAGSVRLYSPHTPCISCMAVFAQFRRLFPRVNLSVAFGAWPETREQVLRLAREGPA